MLMGQPERSAVKEEVGTIEDAAISEKANKSAQSEIVVSSSLEKMREEKEEEDVPLPAPLANGALKKILKELPEGARVAAETCVQFWKEKKFPTEELIAFLKNISSHSPTLKKSFEDQHNGFLRAMKLQEEQQRKREEEELMERQQVWMRYNSLDGYPSWNHMRHFQPNSTWSGANNFNAGYFHSYPPNMQFIGSRIANSNMPPHPPYHDSLQPMAEYGRQNLFKRTRLDFSERPVTQTMSSSTYSIDDVSKRQRLPSDEPRSAHGVPQISDADLSAAKKALQGRSQRELADHPLGVWLTKKAQQVTSSVFVKVVADVKKTTQQEGISPHTYRCKAILVFR
ncbi:hypothetical protein GUITHDRAFT_118204 [Guillardia theta CCMP2712]|uniref:Uncharacterized protein n=1 Tax=Guillardia theta (strain CCMP2712) TaxID=905079 RepID=L1II34_GUITC|nr:hypothetical protein GUITHDRAFT_118204 [Guillardia theta CCMP2712]EKX35604.1 hypothetical protein GUITHDRAFT_118204 [Guillardia theta CCMP2712]|eukprot:XP_005822584.1 hypothetical protein GUITHDRAFT_118204 [Guillardia theta CCMP2712]